MLKLFENELKLLSRIERMISVLRAFVVTNKSE